MLAPMSPKKDLARSSFLNFDLSYVDKCITTCFKFKAKQVLIYVTGQI